LPTNIAHARCVSAHHADTGAAQTLGNAGAQKLAHVTFIPCLALADSRVARAVPRTVITAEQVGTCGARPARIAHTLPVLAHAMSRTAEGAEGSGTIFPSEVWCAHTPLVLAIADTLTVRKVAFVLARILLAHRARISLVTDALSIIAFALSLGAVAKAQF
jgi:hypothetical protein